MHFEMETVYHDVFPTGLENEKPFNTREVIRYGMEPPKFYKDIYLVHTIKTGDSLVIAKSPLAPIQNSSFYGSFIAGIVHCATCTRCQWSASSPNSPRTPSTWTSRRPTVFSKRRHGCLKCFINLCRRPSRRISTSAATRLITRSYQGR